MKKLILIFSLVIAVGTVNAGMVGRWNFNGNLDNTVVGGDPMSLENMVSLSYADNIIGGSTARVLSFPAFTPSQWLQMPNEAGTVPTAFWTLVMDVKFPTISGYTSFFQLDVLNTDDADFFVPSNGGGIGIGGQYNGTFNQDTWYRLAVTVSTNAAGEFVLNKYLDGVNVGNQTRASYSLNSILLLFTDEGNETAAGMINSLAYYNETKDDTFISNLGSASVAGISSAGSNLVGLWNFNDTLANEVGGGNPISLEGQTSYSTETIGGSTADVLSFPPFTPSQWLQMPNASAVEPTENYTLIMDVRFSGGWMCFYSGNTNNDSDGCMYLDTTGQIGLGGGNYGGTFNNDTWYRFAITVAATGTPGAYDTQKWLDGSKVQGIITYDGGYGPRFVLKDKVLLFTDNDGETVAGAVNSVALWDEVMSDGFISSIGGPTADGIPIPEPASVILILTALAGLIIRK